MASTQPTGPREVGKSWERLGKVGRGSDPLPAARCLAQIHAAERQVGQASLRRSRGLRDTLGGPGDLKEAASGHHNTLPQAPGTFRALWEGPGTFRKQRQVIKNDSKMIEIMKIVENGLRWVEMG